MGGTERTGQRGFEDLRIRGYKRVKLACLRRPSVLVLELVLVRARAMLQGVGYVSAV